jgi:membrane protein implicated in regulation of membrane protease activity
VRELSSWSTRRVIVACALWIVGAPVLAAIGLILGGLVLAVFSGGQALGFTVKLSDWTWAWLVVPPIALVTASIWSRSKKDKI